MTKYLSNCTVFPSTFHYTMSLPSLLLSSHLCPLGGGLDARGALWPTHVLS